MKELAVAVGMILALVSCEPDECTGSERVCGEDGRIIECTRRQFIGLVDCCYEGTSCIEYALADGSRGAACSFSGELDARCAQRPEYGAVCDGNTLVTCDHGFSKAAKPCPGVCLTDEEGAGYCALNATDARCAVLSLPDAAGCAGDVLVECREGALLMERDCAALDAGCTTATNTEWAWCQSLQSDSRCETTRAFCDSNVAFQCMANGQVMIEPCAAGQICGSSSLNAYCGSPRVCNWETVH